MGPIIKNNFVKELKRIIGKSFEDVQPSFAVSYGLLHEYSRNTIIPLIRQKNVTIATVELTTCGLISDLLTGDSGASHFFILGMTPYSNEMKIKLGIRHEELSFEGYGVVSPESAKDLALRIMDYSGAKVGIAETGLLTSSAQFPEVAPPVATTYLLQSLGTTNFSQAVPFHTQLPGTKQTSLLQSLESV